MDRDDDYDDDRASDEEVDIDELDEEVDEDALLNDGVDNSAKENKKEDEEEKKEEESDDEEVIIEKERKEKPKFVSGHNKLHFNEYSKTLSTLATAISESKVTVPEKFEKLLNCESGNVITISENWIKHRDKVPLPTILFRTANGFIPEKIDYGSIKTIDELCFQDIDEEGNYFETCFRKNGYPTK